MAIITITRGSLSATARITDRLAARLGYPALSREEAIEHGEKYGIGEFRLAAVATMEQQPPTWWDRHAVQRCHYLMVLKAALMDFAVEGNLIYHGNLGQYLLSDVPNLIRIRVDADFESRVETLMKEVGLSKAEAQAHIADIDNRRGRWVKFLYGADFTDSANYDLILNMAKMSPDVMADVIACLVKQPVFEMDEAAKKKLRDIRLKSLVEAHLVRSPRTRGMELDIECDADTGLVNISGHGPAIGVDTWASDIKSVLAMAEELSGVEIRVQ